MIKNCIHCQIEFEPTNNKQQYCTPTCRRKFHNSKSKTATDLVIKCLECGIEFFAEAFVAHRKKYCSISCQKKFNYRKKYGRKYISRKSEYKPRETIDLPETNCRQCNKMFKPQYTESRQFCSRECKVNNCADKQRQRRKERREATVKVCPICNTSFSPQKSLKEMYCSNRCQRSVGKRIYKMMQSCYEATNTPKADHSHKVLGYSPNQLLEHLKTFADWEILKTKSWHLDHIFPIVAFIREDIKDISLICCLENLRPLDGVENNLKNDTYDKVAFEEWLLQRRQPKIV